MKKKYRRRSPVVLVFGENDNDQESLRWLIKSLRPDFPKIEKRRRPPVLVKGRDDAKARKNTLDISKVVRATNVRSEVKLVVAHQDCDAIEPAHEDLTRQILYLLNQQGVRGIPATPAWEMEAWWFLWPDAALRVNSSWRKPAKTGQRVGLINNAKEEYRRALRPKTRKRTRDYAESDSPKIAQAIFELGIINNLDAISHSYECFRDMLIDFQI